MERDVVCGMQVDPAKAAGSSGEAVIRLPRDPTTEAIGVGCDAIRACATDPHEHRDDCLTLLHCQ